MAKPLDRTDSDFSKSTFSWARDLPPSRNQFVSFERRFALVEVEQAQLHLFADTRYRLFVNGAFVAYGPGRFVTAHPEYDTHELEPHLRRGENTVRVEVNYYGCSSYQSMPDGSPGFIAAGGIGDGIIDFATPGEWLATIHEAWDPQAPYFSFAQNPCEICDTRILADELAKLASHPVVALPPESTPWNLPLPRTAPYPDYVIVRPPTIIATGPTADSRRWGVQLHRSLPLSAGKEFLSFVTWIHSPREQAVEMEIFWTESKLNGDPVEITYPGLLGNHGVSHVTLKEGWNFLGGNYEILLDQWPFVLGLPVDSGATLHALPNLECRETFGFSGPLPERRTPDRPANLGAYVLPDGWKLESSDLSRITPAKRIAWDTPNPAEVVRDRPLGDLARIRFRTSSAAIWSFDFEDEFYGQPFVDVEAPAGSILDIAYDDWKRADGCVNLFHSNPFTDAADRFVLQGGRQRIDVLNPRGGIYLELVLRAPAGAEPATLAVHDVGIRRRTVYNKVEGAFKSGDAVLDWAWRAGVRTLQASTDEAFSDCPWRERGSYIGDCLVDYNLNRLLTADTRTARRVFHTFGLAKQPNGLLPGCAPSWGMGPSFDFSLYWILGVRDIWAHTGDLVFAGRQWALIKGILDSPAWTIGADGLWDSPGIFLDWGLSEAERHGTGNAALNSLRFGALRAAAELAAGLGHPTEAARFFEEASNLESALMSHVWNDREGRFDASIGAHTAAIHANVLALRFGVGDPNRILAYVEPILRENLKKGLSSSNTESYLELFFFFFLLPALAMHGREDLADLLIDEHYGFIMRLEHPTLPETFKNADNGSGSCCHSWSGAPSIYATEYVLGLRLAKPGEPDTYLLDPVDSRHDRVEGTLPHRLGPIHVQWVRSEQGISAKAIAPKGVILVPGPTVTLTRS
ncbi:MAG: hypothetical protein P4L46_04130 [Fimbriimonas sp.]|nr:hypothetical protein [Fimbriimonas sp.]